MISNQTKRGPLCLQAAKLLAERGSRVVFAQVNVEEEKQLSEEHSISSLPTLLLFRKTQPISYSGDREAQERTCSQPDFTSCSERSEFGTCSELWNNVQFIQQMK